MPYEEGGALQRSGASFSELSTRGAQYLIRNATSKKVVHGPRSTFIYMRYMVLKQIQVKLEVK